MLDGQDACNYKNFFWTADAMKTLFASTNVSISDLGCSRDDFFKHRGVSQRFQTAPVQALTNTETTEVNFQVSVGTNVGERVVVVGGCTPLGTWEPRKGLKLHTTKVNNAVLPLWQAQILKSQYVVTFYSSIFVREPHMSREMRSS
jgi:hypothetical protein